MTASADTSQADVESAGGRAAGDEGGSRWRPLSYQEFRRWWLANLTSNVGSWMQTVAAQRVMT